MTKLDLVLARLKNLSQDEQERFAVEIEFMLDHGVDDSVLAPEEEAELARRLADPDKEYVSHEGVATYFEKKFGR